MTVIFYIRVRHDRSRRFSTDLKNIAFDYPAMSPNFQEINRVAPIITSNDVVDKVFPIPLPSYEGQPDGKFIHGATMNIDSNARVSIPKLSIEYKLEPPNNIRLRIKIQNCGYWVSGLEFKIKFCNGTVIVLQFFRTDD